MLAELPNCDDNVTIAAMRVRDWALSSDLIHAINAAKFLETLRRKYYRSLQKAKTGDDAHGNAKLTQDEEAVLLGFVEATVLSGEPMSPGDVRRLAKQMFQKDFGEKWYLYLKIKNKYCFVAFSSIFRWSSLAKRHKVVLNLKDAKQTAKSRVAPETVTSVKHFVKVFQKHQKSI